jgi:hypothetical protein
MKRNIILYHLAGEQCLLDLKPLPTLQSQFCHGMSGPEKPAALRIGLICSGYTSDEGLLVSTVHCFSKLLDDSTRISTLNAYKWKFNTNALGSKTGGQGFSQVDIPR